MVDVNEFCRLLRVERSPFVERLFSMFDTDRGGLIDLKEFIVGTRARGAARRGCPAVPCPAAWQRLTRRPPSMSRHAYTQGLPT
jgi:hypothetical protein